MKKSILYTTTFSLPAFPPGLPRLPAPSSSLKQGPDGVFGVCFSTTFETEDHDHHVIPFFFVEVRLYTGEVVERSIVLPYRDLFGLQVGYDAINTTWIVALQAAVQETRQARYRTELDLYEITGQAHGPWRRLIRLEESESTGKSKFLIAFWQYGQAFPLIFDGNTGDGLSENRLYWISWRTSDHVVPGEVQMRGKNFLNVPFIFDETFLLFTVEYQRRTSQWRFCIAAYTIDGTRIHQELVPKVFFPNRNDGYYIADDLWDWLWPTICLTQGPRYGIKKTPTCVVALLFKEQLERSREWREGHLPVNDHGLPPVQGGLYWVDQDGHILRHEASPLGEQISLCLCGEKIIGTDLLDGQRRLWSWSPMEATQRTIRAMLAPDITRVTLVAMENEQQEAASSFWCVEEYTQGMRVSLWETSAFQEVQSCWVEGLILVDRWSFPAINREPCAVATNQETLLIVGITQERRFQILQFSKE